MAKRKEDYRLLTISGTIVAGCSELDQPLMDECDRVGGVIIDTGGAIVYPPDQVASADLPDPGPVTEDQPDDGPYTDGLIA